MQKQWIAFVLALLLLAGCLTGCTGRLADPVQPPEQEPEKKPDAQEPVEKRLTVLGEKQDYEQILPQFQNQFRDWQVEFISYPDASSLMGELLGGGGPDILSTRNLPADMDMNLLLRSGVFADLNQVIPQTALSLEDYWPELLAGGVYDGKRLVLPQMLYLSTLAVPDAAQNPGFHQGMTLDELYALAEGDTPVFAGYVSFGGFLSRAGIPVLDYDAKQPMVDTDAFREAARFYQKEYASLAEKQKYGDSPYVSRDPNYDMYSSYNTLAKELIEGRAQCTTIVRDSLTLLELNQVLEQTTGQGLTLYPFPTQQGDGKSNTLIFDGLAVNQASRVKTEAVELIKCKLDQPERYYLNIRKSLADNFFLSSQANIDRGTPTEGWTFNEFQYKLESVPEKLEAAFISNAENTRGVFSVMQIIRKFVDPTMEPYFKGESDYEACAAQLESQLRLYLNE